jgi:NCAIR mutase (PurE)-related protein
MATRADRRVYDSVLKVSPKAVFYEQAGIIFAGRKKRKSGRVISVVSAGTADIPVAEEAAVTSELLGNRTRRVYDAGVAGIHRIISCADQVKCANVVIVVAGMEGALASVVGGMVDRPVIAVPTSIGYGAGFEGLAPLLAMINSCAPGIAVVNIDNGFGAGYIASLINGK